MNVDVVTGAAGLIGRALVAELRRRGDWVRGVDLDQHRPGQDVDDYVQADLRDPSDTTAALTPPNGADIATVWHLAGNHGGVAYTGDNAAEILADNIRIDANVSRAANALGYERLLYTSSVAVYPRTSSHQPKAEPDAYPARPPDDYGWSKLTGERLVAHTRNPRIVRLENCYGPPAATADRDGVLIALCRRAAATPAGCDLEVWGDPETERAFLWVDDAVQALLAVMASDHRTPINVSSGEYVTIGHAAQLICDLSSKQLRPSPVPAATSAGSGRRARLDGSVIRALGWSPQVPLAEGLQRLYPEIAGAVEVRP